MKDTFALKLGQENLINWPTDHTDSPESHRASTPRKFFQRVNQSLMTSKDISLVVLTVRNHKACLQLPEQIKKEYHELIVLHLV